MIRLKYFLIFALSVFSLSLFAQRKRKADTCKFVMQKFEEKTLLPDVINTSFTKTSLYDIESGKKTTFKEYTNREPAMLRMETETSDAPKTTTVINKQGHWTQIEGREAKKMPDHLFQPYQFPKGNVYKNSPKQYQYLGTYKVDSMMCYKIIFQQNKTSADTLFIDTKTFLLYKSINYSQYRTTEVIFTDYKKVYKNFYDSQKRIILDYITKKSISEIIVIEKEINGVIEGKFFEPPQK